MVDNEKIRVFQKRIWTRETRERQDREKVERDRLARIRRAAAGAARETGSGSGRGVKKTASGGAETL